MEWDDFSNYYRWYFLISIPVSIASAICFYVTDQLDFWGAALYVIKIVIPILAIYLLIPGDLSRFIALLLCFVALAYHWYETGLETLVGQSLIAWTLVTLVLCIIGIYAGRYHYTEGGTPYVVRGDKILYGRKHPFRDFKFKKDSAFAPFFYFLALPIILVIDAVYIVMGLMVDPSAQLVDLVTDAIAYSIAVAIPLIAVYIVMAFFYMTSNKAGYILGLGICVMGVLSNMNNHDTWIEISLILWPLVTMVILAIEGTFELISDARAQFNLLDKKTFKARALLGLQDSIFPLIKYTHAVSYWAIVLFTVVLLIDCLFGDCSILHADAISVMLIDSGSFTFNLVITEPIYLGFVIPAMLIPLCSPTGREIGGVFASIVLCLINLMLFLTNVVAITPIIVLVMIWPVYGFITYPLDRAWIECHRMNRG